MRVLVKGGIWKNTEDEILKAAVMKYGKNQWSRIASLMNRKSAKQCKARWYEWLDPSIKKTEWSREEEEKLLHLAKIMPSQWRTIAPIVGRTAAQCLEHYEKLLDAASAKADDDEFTDDPRRLRPGEIDPNPEAKPARPDAVDMEEDEKEMLQEARARLANTKGKKAKRKAREKLLEEAKRLASLQKRRELKAAGLAQSRKRRARHGQIDYINEIPFHHTPAAGFFSIADEKAREIQEKSAANFTPQLLQKMEGERRDVNEQKARKKDINKVKEKVKKGESLEQMVQQNELLKRRTGLVMPSPQMSESELNQLAKLTEEQARLEEEAQDDENATAELLSSYPTAASGVRGAAGFGGAQTPGPAMVERTPARPDTLLLEAQNLRNITSAPTPLLGGQNVALNPSDYSGITPQRQVVATPNVFATPLRQQNVPGGTSTPARGSSGVGATPRRDGLGLNEDDGFSSERLPSARPISISQGLASLPKPREYKIALPDADDLDAMDIDEEPTPKAKKKGNQVPDMEDIAAVNRAASAAAEEKELRLRSTAIQRDLPRPAKVNSAFAKTKDQVEDLWNKNHLKMADSELLEEANELIKAEMVKMLTHDAIVFPTKAVKPPPGVTLDSLHYERFDEDALRAARNMLKRELAEIMKAQTVDINDFNTQWEQNVEDIIYLPHQKKFSLLSVTKNETDKIRALQFQYDEISLETSRQQKAIEANEKKLEVLHKGYRTVSERKEKEIAELREKLEQIHVDTSSFKMLRDLETAAIPKRLESVTSEIDNLRTKESDLQQRYAELMQQKIALVQQAQGSGTL